MALVNLTGQAAARKRAAGLLAALLPLLPESTPVTAEALARPEAGSSAASALQSEALQPDEALQPASPAASQNGASQPDEALQPGSPVASPQPGEALQLDGFPVIGELLVPVLDVDAALIGEYSKTNLKTSPCVISGSIIGRDLVIAGGNYRSHFGGLKGLLKGDTVMLCDLNGNLFLYDVETVDFPGRETPLTISDAGFDLSLYCFNPNGAVRYAARCTLCE